MQHRVWIVSGLLVLLALFAPGFQPRVRAQGAVAVEVKTSRLKVSPGDQFAVAIVFQHDEGWHIHTNDPVVPKEWEDFAAIPTVIEATSTKGLLVGPTQWPTPHTVHIDLGATGTPQPYGVFEGRAVAFVPVIVEKSAGLGKASLTLAISFQACDDKVCQIPEDLSRVIEIEIVAPGGTGSPGIDADFSGFDPGVYARMLAGEVTAAKPLEFNFFGKVIRVSTTGAGLLAVLALALLGGLLLNFTPCVLPVIPIKIMALQHSAGNASRRVLLGGVMFAGVIAFWMGIALAIAFVASFKAINQLFQYPGFSIGVGVFVLVMGVGMLGLFAVNLPQWVYAIDPKRESLPGSFLFGVMTAVLSTPCTAPFMGTAAAWAAKQPSAISLSTFASIGVGMGLPYFLLALFPGLVAKVPRTGKASELIKQVMGLLMIAVAVFFVGTGLDPLMRLPVDEPMRWHWWLVGAIVVLAGVWLVSQTVRITPRALPRAFWGVVAAGLVVAGVWMGVKLTDRGPIRWVGYTPERFAEASAGGKVVVMDFTAEWCINCKALENGVLHRPEVVELFTSGKAVPMRVDLTGENKPGQARLQELHWVGIPLLAITGPGLKEPVKLDTYTVQAVLDGVSRARGGS